MTRHRLARMAMPLLPAQPIQLASVTWHGGLRSIAFCAPTSGISEASAEVSI
jgi:hypothetical protein